jgi:hypothetical protein
LNGVSVCENPKKVERPYPDHYWIIRGTQFLGLTALLSAHLCMSSRYTTNISIISSINVLVMAYYQIRYQTSI